jgi:two-component system response regulator FixJ
MTARRCVHVVDDDTAVRNAIGGLLTLHGFDVRHYPSGQHLLDAAGPLAEGCILLDLRMPGPSGLEVQAELARRGVELPIVFLTAHGDVPTGVSAMKHGAVDFLTKPVREPALLEALGQAFGRLEAEAGRRRSAREARARLATLTPREREVIELVASGLRNKEIAVKLDIMLQTVKVHRMRGMAKLGADDMLQLARLWQDASQD